MKSALKRFGRVAISVTVAGIAQYASSSPYALLLAPALNAVGKWMRDRGFNYIPV